MDNYEEMLELFADVVAASGIIRHTADTKANVNVLSHGKDLGEIVTEHDISISKTLLDGPQGFRARYPGSFSEESDDPRRKTALKIVQVDPLDGTGDFTKTVQSDNPMFPTTLVSMLERTSTDAPYVPKAGLIYDVGHQIALLSDNKRLGLYCVVDGRIQELPHMPILGYRHKELSRFGHLRINQRTSYPQRNYDCDFIEFIRNKTGMNVEQVPVGGAGTMQMQLFLGRMQINPCDLPENIKFPQPIDLVFNAQPDHKTWDLDPAIVIGNALFGWDQPTDIYGNALTANAANPTLKDMHHTQGYVLTQNITMHQQITELAREFQRQFPDKPLTKKDY